MTDDNASQYAGDIEPDPDIQRTIAIVKKAYNWTVANDGTVCGLVAGDMGWAGTCIVIPKEDLESWAYFNMTELAKDKEC